MLARPILADIAPPGFCARLVSYTICIEAFFGSLAPGIVASIAQDTFGYVSSRKDVAEMMDIDRKTNSEALRQSFFMMQLVGCAASLVCFVLLNTTIRQDCRMAKRTLLPAII